MKKSSKFIGIACLTIGILLIIISTATLIYRSVGVAKTNETNPKKVEKLLSMVPGISDGALEDNADTDMVVVNLDGNDYVGILEMPSRDVSLPVRSDFKPNSPAKRPAVYYGSVYDSSLIVAVNFDHQFDFAYSLEPGENINFIDMLGGRYRYRIDRIYHLKEISLETLKSDKDDLTIFLQKGTDYLVIRCTIK